MVVWSLGWEDPLEKEMAIHSSIFAWRIPWTEEPGSLQSTGSQRVDTTEATEHACMQVLSECSHKRFMRIHQRQMHCTDVQFHSGAQSCPTLWTAAHQASLSITNSWRYSNSCPSSQWCHPTISSSVVPFSSHLQSFPASGSFLMSQFFASGGQSIGVSASASVLPMNIQDWSALGWTGWISLQSKGLSRVFSNTTAQKHQFFGAQLLYSPTLTSIDDYWKNHSFD